MPMIVGAVSVTGGVSTGTGLAKELFDGIRDAQELTEGPQNATPLHELAKFANTIAQVVVTHIQTNGTIAVNVSGAVASGIPVATAGSATAQVGQTTSPGTFSGAGTGTIS
jgi:hypothetical protein